MANPFSPLEKAALLALATYVADNKAKIMAAVIQPVQYGVDDLVHFIKNAEPHGGLASLLDSAINAFLDNADAAFKAGAPTELGALVDYAVTAITNLANKV